MTGILIAGKAGAGKDTVASYLVRRYGFKRYAFADKLKEIARDLFPDAFGSQKPRMLLQNIGSYMRMEDPDVWVKYVLRKIENEKPERAVISDCRYRNELELCVQKGFLPVLVLCSENIRNERLIARGDRPLTPQEANHPSENDVFDVVESWPGKKFVLDNSGSLEQLYEQVDRLMEKLGVQPICVPSRPSWQETFMEVAHVVARRSTCLRRQVGAVLVKDNRIIATGYNGAPKGMAHCTPETCLRGRYESGRGLPNCRAVHAEENCVIQAALFGVSTAGAELYVTHYPCSFCARTLINAGISKVYYAADYPDELAGVLFSEAGISVVKLEAIQAAFQPRAGYSQKDCCPKN